MICISEDEMWTYNGPLEPCGENGFGMVIQLGAGGWIQKGENGGRCTVEEGFLRSR